MSDEIKPINQQETVDYWIADEVKKDPAGFAHMIVNSAFYDGDATALKKVTEALEEMKFRDDEKLKLSDGQIKNIILLAAERIRKAG